MSRAGFGPTTSGLMFRTLSTELCAGVSAQSKAITVSRPVCFVCEGARASRHFFLGKGHPMGKL